MERNIITTFLFFTMVYIEERRRKENKTIKKEKEKS
jgi:hypothetical protein